MSGELNYQRAKAEILDSLEGTQAEIAAAVGVSQQYVQLIKAGKKTPSPDVLDRLAKLAGGELVIEFRKRKAKQ